MAVVAVVHTEYDMKKFGGKGKLKPACKEIVEENLTQLNNVKDILLVTLF